ncbi:MAG: methyltransferase domain-containing protein [Phycisphaerae bacterium]|nr:methyltransferase domain-containing protein [Phycisphaerae bacterium]
MTVATNKCIEQRRALHNDLRIALPPANLSFDQDEEWCVVCMNGEWREIRLHDYDELFAVPGLYERLLSDILKCDSPARIRELLEAELVAGGQQASALRVLDLGAGNGMVGEELAEMGVKFIVGVDIIEAAAEATQRDRPGIYADYHIVNMTQLKQNDRCELVECRFNCLTCVAALGFGDIPTEAFANAYNLIEPGGWIAFNIKADFLHPSDDTGFARFIRSIIADKTLEISNTQHYQHRIGTNHQPIQYVAIVGNKRRDVSEDMLP